MKEIYRTFMQYFNAWAKDRISRKRKPITTDANLAPTLQRWSKILLLRRNRGGQRLEHMLWGEPLFQVFLMFLCVCVYVYV